MDYVITYNQYQSLFSYSIAFYYLMFIRLNLYLIYNDTEKGIKKFQYLLFTKYQTNDELMVNYGFNNEQATSFNKMIVYLINITKANEISYVFGIAFVISRIMFVAFIKIDTIYFVFVSIPNAISLLLTAAFQINAMSFFYLVFWINCIFINEYLKVSINEFKMDQLRNKKINLQNYNQMIDQLVHKEIIRFNYILRLFSFIQQDANYTVASEYRFNTMQYDLK